MGKDKEKKDNKKDKKDKKTNKDNKKDKKEKKPKKDKKEKGGKKDKKDKKKSKSATRTFKDKQRGRKPGKLIFSEYLESAIQNCTKHVNKVVNSLDEGEKWEDPDFDVENDTLYCLYLDPDNR